MTRRVHRSLLVGLTMVVTGFTVAACGSVENPGRTFPVASVGPGTTVTLAVNQTRTELVRVLETQTLQLIDTQVVIRKAESPLLVVAPRAVYQVLLPKDPAKGFIVVYEFNDPARAAAAAAEQQASLGTGPGRVQTPQGTVTILRQVGSTVVWYDWLPNASQDPSAAGIQTALESLGIGFPIPN